ncbi:unnamed protein product [Echinostoma caproni]|uniref:Extensin-like n=1 Tax=Echinostoma caproni TaxID=27848 RepID=A0A183A928_9TREM|nr:unnamed protein product [Echinostoma caproni]
MKVIYWKLKAKDYILRREYIGAAQPSAYPPPQSYPHQYPTTGDPPQYTSVEAPPYPSRSTMPYPDDPPPYPSSVRSGPSPMYPPRPK